MPEPLAGFGLGMRQPHYRAFTGGTARVDFIEVISENFMVSGGKPLDTLLQARANYPLALHGVSLSVGSADGLRDDYLAALRRLVDRVEPAVVSDHLCWTRIDGFHAPDLLPLPYTEEALDVVCCNIDRAQTALGRRMLFENPSRYIAFPGAMTEWEFLAAMAQRTGCGLLLDVNNIHVSAVNHGFAAEDYLAGFPMAAVGQIHLAGHVRGEHLLIDTHDQPVPDEVWALYRAAIALAGAVPTMIERDGNIPELDELCAELDVARRISAEAAERAAA
ncbi:DUF692 domain-containing protein [Novosphingobium sp. PASSN1]|uniref:MNIO family bufferin maturase n=1 Tax=Novosphingobium sp. PASSN1 TaxID=2015561 RepID=UPI000BDA6487|nr:DUF692 domain-containing protein [Novosphingobium sp. PASSN1]OYU33850.1 MAG: hypothetical protein CFE35_17700 [Novosphingobium sp. PASSN1]